MNIPDTHLMELVTHDTCDTHNIKSDATYDSYNRWPYIKMSYSQKFIVLKNYQYPSSGVGA